MKYEVEFNKFSSNDMFCCLFRLFNLSELNFHDKDLARNITCSTTFENKVEMLRIFCADTEVGTYNDDGYSRIGYARINSHEFVKNGEFKPGELNKALMEIAHPDGTEN